MDNFYFKALAALTDDALTLDDLIKVLVETGENSVKIMELLDSANNSLYSAPTPTKVNVIIFLVVF
ncbi:hypothetical protein CSC2_06070 [Clostridium zeae]|uniref:Uncharacterized protein n=1 Tax=Clostridium zeae TaxID=2759022 RepID=A0ABQ1E5W0_9CLOT|nr:hypothetical protein CSC2_06070 [Clostridium zeae]